MWHITLQSVTPFLTRLYVGSRELQLCNGFSIKRYKFYTVTIIVSTKVFFMIFFSYVIHYSPLLNLFSTYTRWDNIWLCPAWKWINLLKNFVLSKLERFLGDIICWQKRLSLFPWRPPKLVLRVGVQKNKTVSTLVSQTSLFLCKRFLLPLIIMNSCHPREWKRCCESVFEICDRCVTLRLDVTFHGHCLASNNYQAVATNRLEKGVQNFFFIAIHQNYRGEPCKQQHY